MQDRYRLLFNHFTHRGVGTTLSAKQGKHADRSVRAGRSQLLSDTPSLYVLLYTCQNIVGHREGDFDFGLHLS
jgi:hypothetical protein